MFNFFLGNWDEAVRHIPAPNSRHYGPTLAYWYTIRSMIARKIERLAQTFGVEPA